MNDEIEIDPEIYLPCFRHLVQENDIDIELVYGGRDSGKSKHIAMQLLEECMTLDYFRCLLVKKTFNTVKGAQWQMIKDTAYQWNVGSLFKFGTNPLTISCSNSNTFDARGLDSPENIRSYANPSHCWLEEGNQATEEDFITLLTSLRSDYGPVKLFVSFNPEANTADYTDFWLYKMFFAGHEGKKNFTSSIEMPVVVDGEERIIKLKYRVTHVTKEDNPYVTLQRQAIHESLKKTNYYWYKVFTLGEWGNVENDAPWLFAFSREKHVSKFELKATTSEILYTSWDFNRNPAACVVIQWIEAKKLINIIEVFKISNVGTEGICQLLNAKYPTNSFVHMVTGDYSGDKEQSIFMEQVTNYTMIRKKLGLADGQVKIKPNPRLKKNRTLVNAVFAGYNVQICPVKAIPAIFDCENVRMIADGEIEKKDRKDPAQQADVLDCIRYFINQFLGWFVKEE